MNSDHIWLHHYNIKIIFGDSYRNIWLKLYHWLTTEKWLVVCYQPVPNSSLILQVQLDYPVANCASGGY